MLKNRFLSGTFKFLQPRRVLLQDGVRLLQRAAHLLVGEPVEPLTHQAAVRHLRDKHQKKKMTNTESFDGLNIFQTVTYDFTEGAPLVCPPLPTGGAVIRFYKRHLTRDGLGQD